MKIITNQLKVLGREVTDLVMGVLCASLLLFSCSNEGSDPTKIVGNADGFADEDVCGSCHAAEVKLWTATNHDNAMMEASDETVFGDFDNSVFRQHGKSTRFTKRDGGFFVETEDGLGDKREFRVTHTFGVEPLQQYLLEFPGGRKQVLPIAWDVKRKKWFNAEGNEEIAHTDALHWTKPLHNWNMMCAECHATGLKRGFDETTNTFKTTAHRFDVGCQACHGPMQSHVNNPNPRKSEPTPGVVFERSRPRSRLDALETCARCHSRRAPLSDGHDFEMGPLGGLHDFYLVSLLDEDLYFDDGQIKGEVYEYGSFVQSNMYQAGVICTDCHDPHSTRLKAEGNALCTSCHNTEAASKPHINTAGLQKKNYDSPAHHQHKLGSLGALCVNCHAPTRVYMQIDPRHDHSFRIPRPDLTVKYGVPNACNQCHNNKSATWATNAITLRSQPSAVDLYLRAIKESRAEFIDQKGQPAIRRASVLERLAQRADESAIEGALRSLTDPDPMVRIAASDYLYAVTPSQRTIDALHTALTDPVRSVRFAAFTGLQPDPNSAQWLLVRKEYVTIQNQIGGLGDGAANLGVLALTEGNTTLAESYFRKAIHENAYSVAAIINLADVVRIRSESDAQMILISALKQMPSTASLHYALALSFIRQKQYTKATTELKRATELDPNNESYSTMFRLVQNR